MKQSVCKNCRYYPKCVEMKVFNIQNEEEGCSCWEPKEKENEDE